MPVYDFSEKHETTVRASASEIYRLIDTIDFSESFIIRWLLRLRGMGGTEVSLRTMERTKFKVLGLQQDEEIVIGLAGQFWTPAGNMQDVDAGNFREFDTPGFAKAAWNFSLNPAVRGPSVSAGASVRGPSGSAGIDTVNSAGAGVRGPSVSAGINSVGSAGASVSSPSVSAGFSETATILTTETRIRCLDDSSRSRFGFYWTFIQPFSGWIRNEMLAVIKKKAETRQ